MNASRPSQTIWIPASFFAASHLLASPPARVRELANITTLRGISLSHSVALI